jgi:hypothetical protein
VRSFPHFFRYSSKYVLSLLSLIMHRKYGEVEENRKKGEESLYSSISNHTAYTCLNRKPNTNCYGNIVNADYNNNENKN